MNRVRIYWIVLVIAIIPSVALSGLPVTNVRFLTFDADTAEPIAAAIRIDGREVPDSKYVLTGDADSRVAIAVRADAGTKYYPRDLTIYLEGLNNANPIYNIYLAKLGDGNFIYTRGVIKVASEYINNDWVDRAVALLERANVQSSPGIKQSQFGVYLNYNLARAYLLNCTHRFVDECQDAKSIFDDMHKQYLNNKRFFNAEGISEADLHISSIDYFYKRMNYLRAKWDLSCGRAQNALSAFEELITDTNSNPSLLKELQITNEQLMAGKASAEKLIKGETLK